MRKILGSDPSVSQASCAAPRACFRCLLFNSTFSERTAMSKCSTFFLILIVSETSTMSRSDCLLRTFVTVHNENPVTVERRCCRIEQSTWPSTCVHLVEICGASYGRSNMNNFPSRSYCNSLSRTTSCRNLIQSQ